jgi:hypothetical protein
MSEPAFASRQVIEFRMSEYERRSLLSFIKNIYFIFLTLATIFYSKKSLFAILKGG